MEGFNSEEAFKLIFFVWVGNHWLLAWMDFITQMHSDDPNWHYCVRSIVLKSTTDMISLLNAMHDINRVTKDFNVKFNLVH